MSAPGLPVVLGDVSSDVRAAVEGCLRGLQRRGATVTTSGTPVRCVPITALQWRISLHDSGLPSACQALDEAAVHLLEVRGKPPGDVGRCLPGLVGGLTAAHELIQALVRDLGRFAPPEIEGESALAVIEVGRLTHAFVITLLECAAKGFDGKVWEFARGLARRRDDVLFGVSTPEAVNRADDELRFERSLGLSTAKLAAGDGLSFASRVTAAWAHQSDALDGRLYAQLPHLLNPSIVLSNKVRLHLAWLSVCDRPLVAHRAAVAGRDLVRRVLVANPESCLSTIAEQATQEQEPGMYFTHQGLVKAVRAFKRATDPSEQMRPALQMYHPVMEGDVRRVARVILRLLGRQVGDDTTLTVLTEQLAAKADEPISALLASCVQPAWRNAIAHEQVWWDSAQQRAMLASESVDPSIIADAALRAHEICAGFETGVAVALNEAGNPHVLEPGTGNEVARSIYLLLALGEAGVAASKLQREGTTVRLQVEPLTVQSMSQLLGALILAAAYSPEVKLWDIRQSTNRPPFLIANDAITAALSFADIDDRGQRTIEMPISGLPLILSGLINHDPDATSIVSSTIALAAVNIIGERDRLTPRLAAADAQASAELLRTMARTARAVEAAATLADPAPQRMLDAFVRLVSDLHRQLTHAAPAVAVAGLAAVELAFRLSAPARLPWLEDVLTDTR